MFTIRPRDSRSIGRNACVTERTPSALTSNCARATSRGVSSSGAWWSIPAQLTSPHRQRPSRARWSETIAAALSIWLGQVTSNGTAVMDSSSNPAGKSVSEVPRIPAKTRLPLAARWRAVAAPIPDPAPVTRTVFTLAVVTAIIPFNGQNREPASAVGHARGADQRRQRWLGMREWLFADVHGLMAGDDWGSFAFLVSW